MAATKDRAAIAREFAAAVNMDSGELAEWLDSPESLKVGWKGADGRAEESVGHASGRRIVAMLKTRVADWNEADFAHARKVIGFIHRHRAQRPANIVTSRWRYSLMNWGHDPLKEELE